MPPRFSFLARVAAFAAALATSASGLELRLPTENNHLFTGEPDKFYMYVDRTFEGVTSKPWEGGSFGFVRTPIRVGQDVVLTKFHEGIDIAPIKRDKAGNPLDLVMAITGGTVMHVSSVAGRSNYGKYVVVEHVVEGDAFYSVYAHLSEITVLPGDEVKTGSVLGRMGYTGAGLNRTRAHLHLELCLLMSMDYAGWHQAFSGGTNYHGIFNGMNLAGMDVASLYLAQRKNPDLRLQDFVKASPAYFKVTIPRTGEWDFANRHRWLMSGSGAAPSPSWELTFTATGLVTGIAPSPRTVDEPVVTSVRDSRVSHRLLTRGLIDGKGQTAVLTRGGRQLVALLTNDFPQTGTPR